ncbi:hypothetical protein Tco_1365162 [Tanacetum coccineum]
MNQEEIRQVTARDEKWVPTKERVKIGATNVRLETTVPQKEETFQVIIDVIKNSTCYMAFTISTEVPEIFMQQFWYTVKKILDICLRVQGEDFTEVPNDQSTLTFLIDLGYKGLLYKYPNMFVDHMHQPWRTLAAIINKCLFGKSTSNEKLRKSRIDILWGMFHKENVDYSELIWEDFAFQINNRQLKKGRLEIMPSPSSRRVIKKKVTISAYDNIIPEPDVVLELGKSTSLTEATGEKVARQVHAPHERIMTESDPEPARRRPSGTAFKDTSQVSKKMSHDPKKSSRSQSLASGSSEGTGVSPGVPDETIVIPATSSEGTKSEHTEEDDDEKIEWVDTHEEEEKKDEDDDKIINIEKTDDEETDDEFVHSDEHVQNDDEETNDEFVHGDEQVNDDEDEEITNDEDADTRNSDEEITDAAKADAEKSKEAKDDIKEVELPPLSSSLSISLGFGNQFLNLSSAKSTVGNLKDSADAEINSLLDVKIQQEIPQIQSSSILSVPVFVISKPSVLTPIPETPSVV